MKDSEARAIINLLQKRLKQLNKEIQMLKHPHPKNCECKWCQGWTPDHFAITFDKTRGDFGWFEE
jgi:hypothetical protein